MSYVLMNYKKYVLGFFALLMLSGFVALPGTVSAQSTADEDLFGVNFGENIGLARRDPREVVALVIRVFMGFLGTIAVVIILFGGFKWMTAGGNEEKVGEAKKLLASGMVGLIIILMAYAIATFVLTRLISIVQEGQL